MNFVFVLTIYLLSIVPARIAFQSNEVALVSSVGNITNQSNFNITVIFPHPASIITKAHVSVDHQVAMSVAVGPITTVNSTFRIVSITNITGEGLITITFHNDITYINGSLASLERISVLRDITAPNVTLISQVGHHTTLNSFIINISFTELIFDFSDQDIIFYIDGFGGGSMSPLYPSCSRKFNCRHYFLVISQLTYTSGIKSGPGNEKLRVIVGLMPESVHDHAGNVAPMVEMNVSINVDLSAVSTNLKKELPSVKDQREYVWDFLVLIIVLSLVLGVCGFGLVIWHRKRMGILKPIHLKSNNKFSRVPNPEHDTTPEKEFEKYGEQVFQAYKCGEKTDNITLDQIVDYSIIQKIETDRCKAEEAAQKLIDAAGSDGGKELSLIDFLSWLRKVIAKGQPISRGHVKELRRNFSI